MALFRIRYLPVIRRGVWGPTYIAGPRSEVLLEAPNARAARRRFDEGNFGTDLEIREVSEPA